MDAFWKRSKGCKVRGGEINERLAKGGGGQGVECGTEYREIWVTAAWTRRSSRGKARGGGMADDRPRYLATCLVPKSPFCESVGILLC